jgi:opacity protein-like surface antigen
MTKRFGSLAAFAAALLVTAVPAGAGDFTGFYAGVQLGDTFGDASSSQNRVPGAVLDVTQSTYKFSALSGGVHAGYNHPFNGFTLGAVFDVNLTDASDSDEQAESTTVGAGAAGDEADDNSLIFDTILSLRAKGGYQVMPSTLLYATAGYAWAYADAKIERTETCGTPLIACSTAESQDISFSGFTYGLGTSFSIADNTTLSFEWRHYSFDSDQVAFQEALNSYDLGFDPDMDTVELSVSYFFSGALN